MMISGGSDYVFSVDDDRGVLLRVLKMVNGEVAEINEFRSIEFDAVLSADLFAPLS